MKFEVGIPIASGKCGVWWKILNHYYGIKYWEFPTENLCPPIPGRADYIHHMADLLGENNFGKIPIGKWCKLGRYKTFVYNVAKLYRKTMWEPFCIQPVKI